LLPVVVRTWNLFHGNTVPPQRDARLEEMVRLAAAGAPAAVCLQELPAWPLELLDDWSGMIAVSEVARRPPFGAEAGRAITELHHGLLRSAVSGQANAVLVSPSLHLLERTSLVLNARAFRRSEGRRLGLPPAARLVWARERRICQALRLALPDGRTMTLANLHATSHAGDRRLAEAEILRAAVFLDAVAAPGDISVLAGDFNVPPTSPVFGELGSWGFSEPGPGIDHVLVRGSEAGPEERWPDERRCVDGLLLSDHAPVEVRIA
jgi:endonuclease/exonuclease/phosphatase family metal-dependent hydrolase